MFLDHVESLEVPLTLLNLSFTVPSLAVEEQYSL